MDDQYYIRSRGRVQGPYTSSRLKELAKRGQFSRHHHISADRENWERASAHPELFPDVRPPKLRRSQPSGGLFLGEAVETAEADETELKLAETVAENGDSRETEWFYTSNGKQVDDPITFSQLRFLASTGQLAHDDHVWTGGMPNWTAASTIPDLFPWLDEATDDVDPKAAVYEPTNRTAGHQSTAPMAVASFVLGLLGTSLFFFVGSILAVVFGHIALKQISDSENRLGGRGLAIAGLILGYLVLITGVIVSVVMICLSLLSTASPHT